MSSEYATLVSLLLAPGLIIAASVPLEILILVSVPHAVVVKVKSRVALMFITIF